MVLAFHSLQWLLLQKDTGGNHAVTSGNMEFVMQAPWRIPPTCPGPAGVQLLPRTVEVMLLPRTLEAALTSVVPISMMILSLSVVILAEVEFTGNEN